MITLTRREADLIHAYIFDPEMGRNVLDGLTNEQSDHTDLAVEVTRALAKIKPVESEETE